MSYFAAVKLRDTNNVAQGVLMEDNTITTRDYEVAISDDGIASHKRWNKIGYAPVVDTSETTLWSGSAVTRRYVFPTAAAQWRIAAGNAADLGTVIKGNAEGANQTVLCDAGGTTTTLNDADVDFTAATAVAVGDCLLIDPKGTTPEWAYVTGVATHTLTFAGGLSSGGSCATARAYTVVDQSSAVGTGAQVVKIEYLDSAYAEKSVIVCLNGATAVSINGSGGAALTDFFRCNSFRVIAVGTGGVPVAAIQLQLNAAPNTLYSYITAGFTRARNIVYTVPAGKTLFINEWSMSWTTPNDTKVQAARFYTRANVEPSTMFNMGSIFFPYTETVITNGGIIIPFIVPTLLPAKTDLKVEGIASTGGSGPATTVLRG